MTDPQFFTLADAKAWLLEHVDDGAHCPCCTQLAKVYRRKINSSMARSLIILHRGGNDWQYVPDVVGSKSREESKLAYWGLLEEAAEKRDDGGRQGWWRVTVRGHMFARDELMVQKYARIYDGRCLGHVGSPVSIVDALGTKFDYRELMAGV